MLAVTKSKSATVKIPDDKTSSLTTRDVDKHSMSEDLILCFVNKKKDEMDAMSYLLIFM